MEIMKIFILAILAALAYANDTEEVDPKKRGAGKPTTLNAIPAGQKPEYTYLYNQPGLQPGLQPGYQLTPQAPQAPQTPQVPNSFYPPQVSQYYPQTEGYSQQPQINLAPPPTSQYLNYLPSGYQPSGYQGGGYQPTGYQAGAYQAGGYQAGAYQAAGYQPKLVLVPSKGLNGLQFLLQQQSQPSIVPYQGLYQSQIPNLAQGFNYQPATQPFAQPSNMILLTQPNSGYQVQPSNILYSNPNLVNYLQGNPNQGRYNVVYANAPQDSYSPQGYTPQTDYDKLSSVIQQNGQKEDNEIAHSTSSKFVAPSEGSSYKNYAANRSYNN